MRRFSLRRLGEAAGNTVRRFPLVLFAAVVTGISAVLSVDASLADYGWRNAAMSGVLGIPLFLAVALVAERRENWNLPRGAGPVANVVVAGLLVVYGLSLPRHVREVDLILFAQLAAGAHFLVAVLPFAVRGDIRGMWQYDLALLLRFLTAAFFSAVLFGGLSLALAALDTLLGVNVDNDVYRKLWFVIAFIFNTAYFLGGVPERLADLDGIESQPRIVRVFAQFILAPLVVVYLAILLIYLVKVVATAAWPSGWIGYLVSSVAVAGILSLLLLKLDFDRAAARWVRVYARLFHVLMVPAVVMLALAIFKRVGQYGVTEPRYLLIVLTGWLAAVVTAGCLRRDPLFKAIPATLAAVAFLTAVGPWSAFATAHRSQLHRLETLLAAHARFDGEVIVAAETAVPVRDSGEISGLLYYLFDHFGPDALGDRGDDALQAALAAESAAATGRQPSAQEMAAAVARYANLEYTDRWTADRASMSELGRFRFERAHRQDAVPVAGWDYLVPLFLSEGEENGFLLEGDSCSASLDWREVALTLARNDQPLTSIDLSVLVSRLREFDAEVGGDAVPDSLLEVSTTMLDVRGLLRVESIWWSEDDEGAITSGTVHGDLLLALPRDATRVRGE